MNTTCAKCPALARASNRAHVWLEQQSLACMTTPSKLHSCGMVHQQGQSATARQTDTAAAVMTDNHSSSLSSPSPVYALSWMSHTEDTVLCQRQQSKESGCCALSATKKKRVSMLCSVSNDKAECQDAQQSSKPAVVTFAARTCSISNGKAEGSDVVSNHPVGHVAPPHVLGPHLVCVGLSPGDLLYLGKDGSCRQTGAMFLSQTRARQHSQGQSPIAGKGKVP